MRDTHNMEKDAVDGALTEWGLKDAANLDYID
jgi:hypothetical protein